MCEEMIKFRELLDANGIEWWDSSTKYHNEEEEDYLGIFKIDRTHFHHRDYDWSVINGYGTFGGYGYFKSNAGFLELMSNAVNEGNPVGWLTAEEAFALVKGDNEWTDRF